MKLYELLLCLHYFRTFVTQEHPFVTNKLVSSASPKKSHLPVLTELSCYAAMQTITG